MSPSSVVRGIAHRIGRSGGRIRVGLETVGSVVARAWHRAHRGHRPQQPISWPSRRTISPMTPRELVLLMEHARLVNASYPDDEARQAFIALLQKQLRESECQALEDSPLSREL